MIGRQYPPLSHALIRQMAGRATYVFTVHVLLCLAGQARLLTSIFNMRSCQHQPRQVGFSQVTRRGYTRLCGRYHLKAASPLRYQHCQHLGHRLTKALGFGRRIRR